MTTRLQTSAVGVLQAVAALSPARVGPRFVKQVRGAGLDLVGAALAFVQGAFGAGVYPRTPDGRLTEADLPLVGVVAEKCQVIRTILPRTPADLIHAEIQRQFQLVDDALKQGFIFDKTHIKNKTF